MTLVLGLISGTSADGVDAALLEVDGEPPDGVDWSLVAHRTVPHADALRERILEGIRHGSAESLCALHAELGEVFGRAARDLLDAAGVPEGSVEAIGSHGQTLWHLPPTAAARGATLQLGDPATIAAVTGVPVVSDFRAADVAAGGHGAPLVPWPDRVLLARPDRERTLLNVGGMANLTWVPRRGSTEPPLAFDTGPGNVLLDAAAALATGGRARCDLDGVLAREGAVDQALLSRLLEDPFFDEPPPRSTGREHFGPQRVEALARERGLAEGDGGWRDLLATFTALSARSVADAVSRWLGGRQPGQVVVTGGGARNPTLVAALADALAPHEVVAGPDVLGPLADGREAAAFALLAWAHLRGVPGNVPSVTGAAGLRVLGSLTPAPGRRVDA
jgi:anhydro-N-acetylmuramic acid kinase